MRKILKKEFESEIIISGVPFITQRLAEYNYKKEKFENLKEAKYWSERICGLACIKMILCKLIPNFSVSLKELLDLGLEIDAYNEHAGWVHKGLIKLVSQFGIRGRQKYIGNKIERIKKYISKQQPVIASVNTCFEAGKKTKGGHLVVLVGYHSRNNKIDKLYLHHPSSEKSCEWPNYTITREDFINSFSGNIIYFFKKQK